MMPQIHAHHQQFNKQANVLYTHLKSIHNLTRPLQVEWF